VLLAGLVDTRESILICSVRVLTMTAATATLLFQRREHRP
jgi:hypothetical protein